MTLPSGKRQLLLPLRVWDLPTRLFHWATVLCVAVCYATSQLATPTGGVNWMQWHLLAGYAVLALVLFRLVWGFVGSETSRFRHFLCSPRTAVRHLARFHEPEPDTQVGHNPAGGWMVLAMLALLALQAGTGLFSNYHDLTQGPLAKYAGKSASGLISDIHSFLFNLLVAAVIFHLAAVAAYLLIKKHNLVRPMVTGKKRLPAATPAPRMVSAALALPLMAIAALAVWALATRL